MEATKVEIVKFVAEVKNVRIFIEGEANKTEVFWNPQRNAGLRGSRSGREIRDEIGVSRGAARSGEKLGVKHEGREENGQLIWGRERH